MIRKTRSKPLSPVKPRPIARPLVSKVSPPFVVAERLEHAHALLSKPPPESWIKRPEFRGEMVCEFALPNELLKTQNYWRGRKEGEGAKYKDLIWEHVERQAKDQFGSLSISTLPGRPRVIAIKWSVSEPDPCSDWGKFAIDQLCLARVRKRSTAATLAAALRGPRKSRRRPVQPDKRRLGLIVDDRGSVTDTRQHWEPVRHRCDELVWIGVFREVEA